MEIFNTHVDLKSFVRKAPPKINDKFGVSFITGYQGSGKTYFAVYILYNIIETEKTIVTNVKSLKIPGRKIIYFDTISQIVKDDTKDKVYLIDEISKKYTKESKQDKDFYSWLQQSRKNRRITLLLTQEYLQIPTWLRGIARYVYTTTKVKFLPLFITYKGYAELDEQTKEWYVVPECTYIYKRNKLITNLYDTFEPVPIL